MHDYQWPRSPSVAMGRGFIRVVSLLAPRAMRRRLLEEWDGELWTLVEQRRSLVRLVSFCVGIVPYALWAARDARRAKRSTGGEAAGRSGWVRNALLWVTQDVSYALRLFRRRPGFSITAVAILGLGIGATTTIYSVVDRVLLRDLPYEDPHQLVFFEEGSHSAPDFVDWRDRTDAFQMLAAANVDNYDLTGAERPERVRAVRVTPRFFTLFGGRPAVGRLFTDADFTTPTQTVILSYGLLQRRWGGDNDILGRRITINGEPLEVVGVLGPDFVMPEAVTGTTADIWLPFDATAPNHQHRGVFILQVAGRLRPDATLDEARAQLDVLAEALANEHPDRYRRSDGTARPIVLASLLEATVHDVAGTLYLLLGSVGLMLLIACANVANLLLARGTGRLREIALRAAVGASRRRVIAQFLTESSVLSLMGGTLGIGLAIAGVRLFAAINPGGIPRASDLAVDTRILGVTLAISVATGMLFGILPALQAARADVSKVIKAGAAGVTEGRGARFLQDGLIVAEMSMAVTLTLGAALLFNAFIQLRAIDPGFEAEALYTVPVALNGLPQEERGRFTEQVLDRMRTLPGTRAVGAGVTVPFVVTGAGRCCWFMDLARTPGTDAESAILTPVTPGYFRALGATIVRGRGFTNRDRGDEPIPLIVNASFVQRVFGDDDPIGQTLDMEGTAVSVVGVVNDVRHWGLTESESDVYTPYAGIGDGFARLYIAIRSTTPVAVLTEQVREAIWSVAPNVPVIGIVPMRDRIDASIANPRFYIQLMWVFAAVALTLAAGGLYSSMLYSVEKRYRELGLRVALGARASDITRLVVRHGAVVAGAGVVVGAVGTLLSSRLLGSLIVGVDPANAKTFGAVAALMFAVTLGASYLPARRAARADPLEMLRTQQ